MKTRLLSILIACVMFTGSMLAQVASFPLNTNVLDEMEAITSTASASGISFVNTSKGDVAELDGLNGFVTFANTVYGYDALTYNLWFQWNNTNSNPWWQRVFDFGKPSDPAPGNHDVMFVTTYQDGKLTWHIHSVNWTDGVDTVLTSKEEITVGKWYMLTMTHAQDSARLYLDGVLQQSKASNIKPSELAFDNCYLGKSNWPDNLFQGRFDDFKIWETVLTPEAIAAMYVPPTTAINEQVDQLAKVYSTGNIIKIDFANESINNSVTIYNVQGAEVYTNANLGQYTEVGSLKTGLYFVKVSNSGNVITRKVIIR